MWHSVARCVHCSLKWFQSSTIHLVLLMLLLIPPHLLFPSFALFPFRFKLTFNKLFDSDKYNFYGHTYTTNKTFPILLTLSLFSFHFRFRTRRSLCSSSTGTPNKIPSEFKIQQPIVPWYPTQSHSHWILIGNTLHAKCMSIWARLAYT